MIAATFTSRSSARIEVWGDLDRVGADTLRYVAGELSRPGMELVVDLGRVSSFDSVGLSALMAVRRLLDAWGGSAKVVNLPAECRHETHALVQALELSSHGSHNEAA